MSGTLNEEAQKKNTDCVYFLASPLTCKKGNECEFRHSESARNNPRDCWYWFSGTCLNANCAFRHPPLDALPEGEQVAAGKSRVPCYYFLQGFCAKGDKCMFMHGLPTASSAAEKALKSKTCGDLLDNQNSANKENGSVTSKACLEFEEASLAQKSNEVQELDANITNGLPEGSDSSAAVRFRLPQHSERTKQDLDINGRPHQQVHCSANEFLHHEAQTEDEPLCDFPPGDDGLGHDPSGEDRAHNGTESEELWEESSFDVLVDDGGTDQLVYAEDLDYLNHYDAIVDHLTAGHIQAGIRGADGFVDFEYDHMGAYSQYYDSEYELTTYDAYERQLVYEHLSSFDPEDGLAHVVPLNGRQASHAHHRDRQNGPFNGEVRPAKLGSNDLRNHISNRRRAENNQEDYYRRRHQGNNGSQHNRRHQEVHAKQHDRLSSRRHLSPQTGSRSNRQYNSLGDPSVGRQFYGRLVDPLGTKRAYRDTGSGPEQSSVERTSGKKFRGMKDNLKAKGKPERGRPPAYEADDALGSRGQSVSYGADEALGSRGHQHSKKAEGHKEDSSFTGPKSLAQIKAEKMKAMGEGGLSQQSESGGLSGRMLKQQVNILQALRSEAPMKEKPGKDSMCREFDFEGPKPLSVILKHKRREDGTGEARVHKHEKSVRGEGNGATGGSGSSSSVFAATRDSLKDAANAPADLSAVSEYNRSSRRGAEPVDLGARAHGENGLHRQQDAACFLTSLKGNELELADLHKNRLDKEAEPAHDAEDGLDVGASLMEDGEYEDDDEDDFAKKLGNFFS